MLKVGVITFLVGFAALARLAGAQPAAVDRQVEVLLGKLTLERKIDLIGSDESTFFRALPEIGLPQMKKADGPFGVRNWGPSTAYAGGIGLAASWDRDLARRVGASTGRDARARGVHFLFGPGVNIYRAPINGRNFEYFGEDPFLAGSLAVPYIQGVQGEGVVATIKHFAANNSEFDRQKTNSIIDERTLREIYLPAFEAAVKEGGVGAVMDSYNLVNGEHATQNGFLNLEVLKKEWGFRGVLLSDAGATHDGIAAANHGLDLEMPASQFMNRATLLPAIRSGQVSAATIDDKVRRILRIAVEYHFLDRDQRDPGIPLYRQDSRQVALQSAVESMVLLKNEGHLLPLDSRRLRSVAVLGPDADPAVPGGGGSSRVTPFGSVSHLVGLSDALTGSAQVYSAQGVKDFEQVASATDWTTDPDGHGPGLREEIYPSRNFTGIPTSAAVNRIDQWTGWSGPGFGGERSRALSRRYRGYFVPKKTGRYTVVADGTRHDAYTVYWNGRKLLAQPNRPNQAPRHSEIQLEAGKPAEVRLDYVPDSDQPEMSLGVVASDELVDPAAIRLAARADVAVVSVGFDYRSEAESFDRSYGLPMGQDALIRAVEAVNPRTIVVLTAGGGVATADWIEKTPVFLHAFYGGQEAGRALAQVLLGQANPSGRLPFSFERKLEDNPTLAHYYPAAGSVDVAYAEGLFLGYRYYDRARTKPLFPFGFGLSYTTFEFSDLRVTQGGLSADEPVTVSFQVKNTGRRAGAEVAQIYVGDPSATVERPLRELKGFERVVLAPGEAQRVSAVLGRRAFAYWDAPSQGWRVDAGEFTIYAGDSSANLPLHAPVGLPGSAWGP